MRSRTLLLIAAVACLAAFAPSAGAQAPDRGDFQLVFGTFKPANRAYARQLDRSGAIQAVVAEVNRRYALPKPIPIEFSDEADFGPAYVSLNAGGELFEGIFFPGSFLTREVRELRQVLRGVKSLRPVQAMIFANQFVIAHEIGHALVHQLDIPITGREEDAVDGFAAYLLGDNPRFGPSAAFSAALLFDALARPSTQLDQGDFADEHSLPQQRVVNFLCWIYGSDKARFKDLVGADVLPRSRARQCGGEWQQIRRSWSRLLAPYELAPQPPQPADPATAPQT